MRPWELLPESDRRQWDFEPKVSVGPLHFGMGPAEVAEALAGMTTEQWTSSRRVLTMSGMQKARHLDLGVILYSLDERLSIIALDARRGPQVHVDGTPLVGRVPSEMEAWAGERAESRPASREMLYTEWGDPTSLSLGVVLGVQRAGDRLLTRPTFLPAGVLDDDPFHTLPEDVWAIHW